MGLVISNFISNRWSSRASAVRARIETTRSWNNSYYKIALRCGGLDTTCNEHAGLLDHRNAFESCYNSEKWIL